MLFNDFLVLMLLKMIYFKEICCKSVSSNNTIVPFNFEQKTVLFCLTVFWFSNYASLARGLLSSNKSKLFTYHYYRNVNMWCVARFGTICAILKTRKKTHWGVLILTPSWVFFTFFKMYKWYQVAQRITCYGVSWGWIHELILKLFRSSVIKTCVVQIWEQLCWLHIYKYFVFISNVFRL